MSTPEVKLTGFEQETPELDALMRPILDALLASGVTGLEWKSFRIGFLSGLAARRVVIEAEESQQESSAEPAAPTES